MQGAYGQVLSMNSSNNDLRHLWTLAPEVTFLNHGSFGACPIPVQDRQAELRNELERDPVAFITERQEALVDEARRELATQLGSAVQDLVFVPNATTGVNTVLSSLQLGSGDEVLLTDHTYNACRNALEHHALSSGAVLQVVPLELPIRDEDELVDAIMSRVNRRTRLMLIDHVTSVSALIMPLEKLVPALQSQGVMVLVDGAHAPGMLTIDLDKLGADFYTGNCHKWLCAPKGAAFLHVREEHHEEVVPLVISHGWNTPRSGRSRLHDLFDWTGTADFTAVACIPQALKTLGALFDGGWEELQTRNHELAIAARRELCTALGTVEICPDSMLGSMACVTLPNAFHADQFGNTGVERAQQIYSELRTRGFQVPVMESPDGAIFVRVSAQVYNRMEQYARLASALAEIAHH